MRKGPAVRLVARLMKTITIMARLVKPYRLARPGAGTLGPTAGGGRAGR